MPDARVRLTQEGGQWKIQLPQSADANQLAQNIQKQLQQCVQMKDQWPADATQAQLAIAHSVLLAFSEQPAAGASGSSTGTGASGASGASGSSSSGTGSSGSSSGTGASGTSGGTSSTPGR
jgi:hypothetical protein